MLDELIKRIICFDARIARFSTTLGINLPASGAHMDAQLAAAPDGPTPRVRTLTPLRMAITVQRLESDMKKTINHLVPIPLLLCVVPTSDPTCRLSLSLDPDRDAVPAAGHAAHIQLRRAHISVALVRVAAIHSRATQPVGIGSSAAASRGPSSPQVRRSPKAIILDFR